MTATDIVSSASDCLAGGTAKRDIPPPQAPRGGDVVYRHRIPTRLWHWANALAVVVMLMSGLMIFNAHPQLYWGKFGADPDREWLAIGGGQIRIGQASIPTFGVLGGQNAFPGWMTIPSHYDLAGARQWHFAFAWLLVVPGLCFLLWGFVRGHFRRDLAPTRDELRSRHLWRDIKDHARLHLPTGESARRYNILQKLAYCGVLFIALPGVVLTGLTMSPGIDAAWPWLLDLFGGRQSARSIHFLCATALGTFIVIHLTMVVIAGPFNEVRSMITGRYRLPNERGR